MASKESGSQKDEQKAEYSILPVTPEVVWPYDDDARIAPSEGIAETELAIDMENFRSGEK